MQKKTVKRILVVVLILALVLSLSACLGNRTVLDTKWKFQTAYIDLGDKVIEVQIKSWKDYDNLAVQVITTTGEVYLTSYENVVLKDKAK